MPRFRNRTRTLLLLVVLVAVGLFVARVLQDGVETHWLALRLSYGDSRMRLAVAEGLRTELLDAFLDQTFSQPSEEEVRTERSERTSRRAELLIPPLIEASHDPDAVCRVSALRSLTTVVGFHGRETTRALALSRVMAAMHDDHEDIRAEAAGSLVGFGRADSAHFLDLVEQESLRDSSEKVRLAAVLELGKFGAIVPETQPRVAPILERMLAGGDSKAVRISAARSLYMFGVDARRQPPDRGPDVVPALVAALRDPEPEVRREVALVLGLTTTDRAGRTISYWEGRKAAILPSLQALLNDEDSEVRESGAVALFGLGIRDDSIRTTIQAVAEDTTRPRKFRYFFTNALDAWGKEGEAARKAEASARESVD